MSSKFPLRDKGLFGERDFKLGEPVRISYRGQIEAFNVVDSCMQIRTATGLLHYVCDADPSVFILPLDASWPPKAHDVWLINNKVWHTSKGGVMTVVPATGRFGVIHSPESILHSVDTPPEMLFRWSV